MSTCNCVLRQLFRICRARFREISIDRAPFVARSKLAVMMQTHDGGRAPGKVSGRGASHGMVNHEYAADFVLVAERALLGMTRYEFDRQNKTEPLAWKIFKFHYLLGADWQLCCGKLGLNRGEFFHEAYRVEQKVGRAFAEVTPCPLFPLGRYFSETARERASRDASKRAESRAAASAALGPKAEAPKVMRAGG